MPRLAPAAAVLFLSLVLPSQAQHSRTFRYAEKSFHVALSRDRIAVGFMTASEGEATAALERHADVLGRIAIALPPHRTAVFDCRSGVSAADAVARIRRDEAVTFANPLMHLGDPAREESWHILTADLCVGVGHGASIQRLAAVIGAGVIRTFAFPGTYLLRLPAGAPLDALDACDRLLADPDVTFAHPDWLRRLTERDTIPNDPSFPNQWHLRNTGQGGGLAGADVKAPQAWDITHGDPGVLVAVIDSGVERNHVDIVQTPNGYNALCGAGPLMGDPVPTGCSSSYAGNHGTSCAGVAAATWNNGIGVAGVAGGSTVMPINLLGSGLGYGTPSMEAACFDWATANGAHVITNSWGPDGVPWPLPALVQTAFINSTTNGRGGLGCVIFWAAGNGNEIITSDGYASSQYTIAVGASTNFDVRSSYSDYGPELDVVAPSNGGSLGISTTSTNSSGASNYTSGFGGTSSASPLAAGVAALVLSHNPALTWTQVRDILRSTAVQINPSATPGAPNYYDPSTGHSTWYGWGRIDAYQALLAAGTPPNVFTYTLTTTGAGDLALNVDNAGALAELYIPFAVNPAIPVGTGPFFGLPMDAFLTIIFPIGTAPFHVLADGSGHYAFSLGPGSIPQPLTADSRVLVFSAGAGVTLMSPIIRRNF